MVELQRSGVVVRAICKPNSKVAEFLQANSVACEFLPNYAKVNLKSVRRVKEIVRSNAIDVVHAHYHRDIWPASLAVRNLKNVRLFLSIYMGVPRKNDPLHKLIFRRVDAILSSSKALNRKLPELYPVPAGKIHYLPYGRIIDSYRRDAAKRTEIRAKYGIGEHETVVGTMVRIDPGKGVADFVESYNFLSHAMKRNVRYLIVGEPTRKGVKPKDGSPFEPKSEEYANRLQVEVRERRLEDKIIFTGYQNDSIGYLSAMDLFVFPSRDEMYSLVVLDAMCLELPIVAARSGGNLDQIAEGQTGLFYTTANAEDLATKLSIILSDVQLRTKLAAAAREFVLREHDMKAVLHKLTDFYSGVGLSA